MKLTVYGPDGQTAADRASARIEELEALLSVTDEGSEIFAANHSEGAAVPVSSDTAALLRKALELCGASEGTLDVTVYPVVRAWGFTTGNYRVPEAGELRELLDRVDYNRVSLEGGTLTLPAGTEIDLGAVAKGYAGDQVMASSSGSSGGGGSFSQPHSNTSTASRAQRRREDFIDQFLSE